jgi:hypothetical protein
MSNQTEKGNCNCIKWIDLSKRRPKEGGLYLVYAPSADPHSPLIAVAGFDKRTETWAVLAYWSEHLTHWAVLPKGPAQPRRRLKVFGLLPRKEKVRRIR